MHGDKVLDGARVRVDATVLRYVRYQMVGDYLVAALQFISAVWQVRRQ
ncbi:MAG: hypothetical protein R3E73_11055 [Porticoccaceae bacterium]